MKLEIFLCFELVFHDLAVLSPVDLSTKGMYCGTFTSVEHTALEHTLICGLPHLSAERVNLTNEMTFCSSADGRIARTISYSVHIYREHNSLAAEPCACKRSLDPRMTCSDHCYIIFSCEITQFDPPQLFTYTEF